MPGSLSRLIVGLSLFTATCIAAFGYFALKSNPAPKCDGEEEVMFTRNAVTSVPKLTQGKLNMDDVKLSDIRTLALTADRVVTCQAIFNYKSAPHGPLRYSLTPLRGYPRFEVAFEKGQAWN